MAKEGRDAKGKFAKGHKGFKTNVKNQIREMRKATKGEIIHAAYSLLKPWQTLKEDLENPKATRLEYLTAQAVSKHNTKFIQWLLEMSCGKPRQEIEAIDKREPKTMIKRVDGTIIEYSLKEAMKNDDEDAA